LLAREKAHSLKRLEGIATMLARTAAREGSLLSLLTADAEPLDGTRSLPGETRLAAGIESHRYALHAQAEPAATRASS